MLRQFKVVFILVCGLLVSHEVQAANIDTRFLVILNQEEAIGLDIQAATKLALPVLWKRIVPTVDWAKVEKLPAVTSLVLQFKSLKYGVELVFNPIQVRSFLAKRGVTMIPEQPDWNLNVHALGFSDGDELLSHDLLNYGHEIADELGFRLSTRGRAMQLIFAPVVDVYGQLWAHVDVQGDFSADMLPRVEFPLQGYTSYQLQSYLEQVLLAFRDAYRLGMVFDESSSDIILTIDADYSLASQVMMEQALLKQSVVVSVVPTLLQKARVQYRIQLRDGDDAWIPSWFAAYGLTAAKQIEGSVDDWLVE